MRSFPIALQKLLSFFGQNMTVFEYYTFETLMSSHLMTLLVLDNWTLADTGALAQGLLTV